MARLKYATEKSMPPYLDSIIKIKPEELPIDAYARIMCQNCGIYARAILCPPLLYKTYPQYSTIDSSREYFNSFDYVLIYVFKNDGTKRFWFKKDDEKFKHWRFRKVTKKTGRELKGLDSVSAKYLSKTMFKIKKENNRIKDESGKKLFEVDALLTGHCDICTGRKCPNRGNPPCKRGGLPSLEATGINVYSLLKQLNVEYEYPVLTYLTQVTMLAVKEL